MSFLSVKPFAQSPFGLGSPASAIAVSAAAAAAANAASANGGGNGENKPPVTTGSTGTTPVGGCPSPNSVASSALVSAGGQVDNYP